MVEQEHLNHHRNIPQHVGGLRGQEQVGEQTEGGFNLPELGSADAEILDFAAEIFFGTKHPFLDDAQRAALFGKGDETNLEFFLGSDKVLHNAAEKDDKINP